MPNASARVQIQSASKSRVWKGRLAQAVGLSLVIAIGAWTVARAQDKQPVKARATATAPAANTAAPQAEAGKGAPISQAAEKPQVAAVVNGQPISRNDLAKECLRHYGKDVLESLINKHMIMQYCKQHQIEVTHKEVDAEITRMAERFAMPTEQWLKMLEQERNIKPGQYANDIIWPTLALRKIAAQQIEPTAADVQEAYETQYGPSVQVRLIDCKTAEKAKQVHTMAVEKPDDFGNLAKQFSDDINSASTKGLIQPIRHHMGDPKIEKVAFALAEGQVSEIVQVGDQFVILKCDKKLPARNVPLATIEKTLREAIRDKKLRLAADGVFRQLQSQTKVENVFNDPQKRQAMPGVAAVVNGHQMTIRELAEDCIERHGAEVLDGMISRKLLEQAMIERKLEVTQADIDGEVARAATSMGSVRDGKPDLEAWKKIVTTEQKLNWSDYLHDVVWPTVALKKVVGDKIEVTEDDMQKGYEANFGERIRCRAIVFTQLRKAQEVWEMARNNPTVEYFGQLATEYSVEPGSKALAGEVPPIQQHGGQPLLEKEAFSLKQGEISSIIQVADKFVILYCEGRTEPTKVEFSEVKDEIFADLHEKKLRLAMADQFSALQEKSTIDNFIAGTTRSPKDKSAKAAISALAPRADTSKTARKPGATPTGTILR